ncbi:MAG: hypothetical protein H6876_03510 [Hyphomicrobiaceae bacterium]|nr:hypothetical protein [Hyphomicrobiaceae bacterium]MCC0007175.1 hypothetical protein [Hyphomicrobiaceae bacterium]
MNEGGTATDIGHIDAPYRREIVLQDVQHESGLKLLRIRIREGRRFTILDIDATTADALADILTRWSRGELPGHVSAGSVSGEPTE